MSEGTSALVAWLGLASVAVVVAGGLLVWLIDPTPADGGRRGFFASVWQAVLHALDPGTVAGDTGHWYFVAVAFLITIGGIFIVTAFIGVLTTGLDGKLQELRKGRSVVLETGHTVILGWSDQAFTVIGELVEANSNKRRACVAVLADKDKVEMEDEIRAKVGDLRSTKVVCRTGDPLDPDDIALVNIAQARSVIILTGSGNDRDAHLVKMLLSVTKAENRCTVVGSVSDQSNMPAARLAGGPGAYLIDATTVAARLIVQTCLQSGLSVVYTGLLDFGGDEIYFRREPGLAGQTYAAALHSYPTSAIIGVRQGDGTVLLNPPSDYHIAAADDLIAISADDDTVVMAPPAPIHHELIVAGPNPAAAPKRALILGWNQRAVGVIEQLDQYLTAGSEVVVVARHHEVSLSLKRLTGEVRNLSLSLTEDDSADRAVLESLGIAGFDHVIALCYDDVDRQVADSRTLVTLLHLRDMEQKFDGKFSIVSEMGDDRNRQLAQVTQADDFIVSDKLLSLMTTQISENPHLADVFGGLFDAGGCEIYLKPAELYVRDGHPLNFQTVLEAARMRGESAIGYRLAANAQAAPAFGIVLNPNKAASVTFGPDDRVIVLAKD
ncbi:CASTOR/POLLUX-related putative ion channel [Dactylosporangium sp. CA-092794]|uniref:CASTOR/POLLUX-related putative ion channel n=1 Tax=Dactylosporangium sp. CA-092794 TaxID=3239929 RepID=UPI003D8F26AD